MEYQQLIEGIQNLSGAQVWLLVAVLIFAVCSVLMMFTFRQFSQHQDDFTETAAKKESQAVLLDIKNCTNLARYVLSERPLMIGRVAVKDSEVYDSVVISDVTVGRRHAVIEHDAGAYWLQDQGSVNGSFVNGQRIEDAHRLRDGDYIKVHKFSFQFVEQHQHETNRVMTDDMGDMTMPQILNTSEISMKPNDVLINYAHQDEQVLHIPRTVKETEAEHQRTQVLFQNDVQAKIESVESVRREEVTDQPKRDIKDMTLQLFKSPHDDKTLRLYSDQLGSPPKERPDYKQVEKTSFSQTSLLPDMDEKVIEALGDFFNESKDELNSQIEITKKGDDLVRMEKFVLSTIKKPM